MRRLFFVCVSLLWIAVFCLSACGKDGGNGQERNPKDAGNPGEESGAAPGSPYNGGQLPKGQDGDGALGGLSDENAENGQAGSRDTDEKNSREAEAAGTAARVLAAPSVNGKLSVRGRNLVDSYGNAVQLRGLSTHGLAWFPQYVNEKLFGELRKEWGANVVRLAMYTAESGGYCTDGDKEKLKELVKNGVQYAAKADLYAIVDWHILSDGNPNQYREEAVSFFKELLGELADYDNVLYEICNEPNGGTSWGEIKAYAKEVIPVIRENAPDAVILVGTPNWSQQVDLAAADPITEYGNLMYTLHFYAATHTGALQNTMAEAVDAGLPVFVSEFGICDASGNGEIDKEQAKIWVQLMDRLKISYVAWNLSNKEETSAVLKSSVDKVSDFTADDLSDSGEWFCRVLEAAKEKARAAEAAGTAESGAGDAAEAAESGTGSGTQGAVGTEGTVTGDVSGIAGNGTGGTAGTGSSSDVSLQGNNPAGGMRVSARNNGLEVTASLSGSWESEGQTFYQYVLLIKNVSGKDMTSWKMKVKFNGSVTLSNGWNGNFDAAGDTLNISSAEYNSKLAAGGSTNDVGFIVSGESGLKIKKIR